MAFDYVSVDEAIARGGLRMVVVGNVPSLWGEAAKGILHVKRLDWAAVRLVYDNDALKTWAGQRSGPVLVYGKEPPLSNWQDILLLAERLAPLPALLPDDGAGREFVLVLSADICSAGGLGWSRRLQLVHAGLRGDNGFPERVAKYLAAKYGYDPQAGDSHGVRVAELLGKLANRLREQHAVGSRYYCGNRLSALDIYSAAAIGMFSPLPSVQCAMDPAMRAAFESRDASVAAALDPVLIEHRDMVYAEHLELPLSL